MAIIINGPDQRVPLLLEHKSNTILDANIYCFVESDTFPLNDNRVGYNAKSNEKFSLTMSRIKFVVEETF